MENIQVTHISQIPTACLSRLPDAMGSSKLKSFTKGPREFGGSFLQKLSSMIDMFVICNICAKCKICKTCAICKIFNLAAPPARSLYTTTGPDGRYAAASRIVANNVVVFLPERRINAAKSNGVGTGGFCWMGGPIRGCMSSSALPPSAGSSECNGGSTSLLESSYPGTRNKIKCIAIRCMGKYAK
jgi:hypothetical protein